MGYSPGIKRKAWHIILTSYPLILIAQNLPKNVAVIISLCLLLFWLTSELLRTRFNINTPTAMLIRRVSRSTTNKTLKVTWKMIRIPYWIIGLTIALIFFNYQAVIAATITLAFGDAASALSRRALNTHKIYIGLL